MNFTAKGSKGTKQRRRLSFMRSGLFAVNESVYLIWEYAVGRKNEP